MSKGYDVVFGNGNTWINYTRTKPTEVQVKRNDKIVGHFRQVKDGEGWQFWPQGQRRGGEIYPGLRAAKHAYERG